MPSLLYLTPVFSTAGAAASAVCYNIGGVWIWRFHQTAISENSGKNAQIFVRRSTMLSKEKAMDGVHLFVLDLDGTVYLGDQPIKGSIEFVRELEAAKDRDFIFFTNNASKVPAVYVEKLRKMGLVVSVDKVVTAGDVCALYIMNEFPWGRVYLNGMPLLTENWKEIGKNPLARKVKMADLTHNMDIRRIKNPRQKDYDRIERKYKPAYAYLKGLE